jgi:hypothetical protein
MKIASQAVDADPKRLHEFFRKDLARMNRVELYLLHIHFLVIVHNLHIMRLAFPPDEADSPLIVDTNTVLACPRALESLQSIPWGNAKFLQLFGRMEV